MNFCADIRSPQRTDFGELLTLPLVPSSSHFLLFMKYRWIIMTLETLWCFLYHNQEVFTYPVKYQMQWHSICYFDIWLQEDEPWWVWCSSNFSSDTPRGSHLCRLKYLHRYWVNCHEHSSVHSIMCSSGGISITFAIQALFICRHLVSICPIWVMNIFFAKLIPFTSTSALLCGLFSKLKCKIRLWPCSLLNGSMLSLWTC